jgi:hypothetical protein
MREPLYCNHAAGHVTSGQVCKSTTVEQRTRVGVRFGRAATKLRALLVWSTSRRETMGILTCRRFARWREQPGGVLDAVRHRYPCSWANDG